MNTHRRRFPSREHRWIVAVELLTVLLVVDLAVVWGRFVRSGRFGHEWRMTAFVLAAAFALLIFAHAAADSFQVGWLRHGIIAVEWPVVWIADRLRILHWFPMSVFTVMWLRLVAHERPRRRYDLRHRRFGPLLARLANGERPEVEATLGEFLADPHSLTEYYIGMQLSTIAKESEQ